MVYTTAGELYHNFQRGIVEEKIALEKTKYNLMNLFGEE
jgi:hypothetical protein